MLLPPGTPVRSGMEGGRGVGKVGEQGGREEGRGGSPGSAQPLTQEAHPLGAAAAAAADAVTGGSSTPAFILRGDITNSADVAALTREPHRHPPSLWIRNRRHLTVRREARRGAGRPPAAAEGRL